MGKIHGIIASLLVSLPLFEAQSWRVFEAPTATRLNGVSFPHGSASEVDSGEGWVVGAENTILHTTDKGNSWDIQSSPLDSSSELRSVSFWNSTLGWAAGNGGDLLITKDGGTTWVRQNPGTGDNIFVIQATSATVVYAAGANGLFIKTTNAGATWNTLSTSTEYTFYCMDFVNETFGWIAGMYGMIFHTSTGGASLELQETIPGSTHDIHGLKIVEVNKTTYSGWIVGDSGLWAHTKDGGHTWNEQPGCGSEYDLDALVVRKPAEADAFPTVAYAVGQAHEAICFTIDQGEIFTVENMVSAGYPLFAAAWMDEAGLELIAVGDLLLGC